MMRRALGCSGTPVSTLALGCWGMSHAYGHAEERESLATIAAALECGINLFDTADIYGNGQNEQLLAKGLTSHSHDVVIATKCGFVGDEHTQTRINGHPKHVRAACDASLKRLNLDTIGVYFLHRVDREVPIEDTIGAMSELVHAGKVRLLGVSEASADTLRRAHRVHPIAVVQSEYSLLSREVEKEVLPTCRELGIALMAFSPLGRGFLTGTVRSLTALPPGDYRRGLPRFREDRLADNLRALTSLEMIATARDATPAQIALSWLLSRGTEVIPIVGTTRRINLVENAAATSIQLSASELDQLDAVAELVSGARHNDDNLRFMQR